MDASALGSLAGSLARAGLPALGTILGAVLPPPWDLLAGGAFKLVSAAMGVDPAAPDAPAQVQARVDADPVAAATKLQTIEQAHKDAADAANEELRLRLLDVQDSRATEVKYIQAGSFIAAVPGIWTIAVVACFISVLVVLLVRVFNFSTEQLSLLNIMFGVLVSEVARCGNFWMGSSQSARLRADQAIDFAHRAPAALTHRK